ncbi:VRR-NUC domain-containing protein [Acinetobacter bereziniae]|uniref:VRR-NUC domain-containing protein n=1 Tax=Acinetobacter bereziniae TaxID=106648 RepID=UPI00125038AB|nr:VRR-NUC domain-containing protein [Acinetobacter bereziniae]
MPKHHNSRSKWTMESLTRTRKSEKQSRMSIKDFNIQKKPQETDLQKDLIKTLKLIRYKGRSLRDFVYAVPNGGYRTKRNASTLKAEGLTAGIPDLHCFVAVHPYHSLYIEMKTETGDLTESQESMIPMLRQEGHKVVICRSTQSALDELFKYLGIYQ